MDRRTSTLLNFKPADPKTVFVQVGFDSNCLVSSAVFCFRDVKERVVESNWQCEHLHGEHHERFTPRAGVLELNWLCVCESSSPSGISVKWWCYSARRKNKSQSTTTLTFTLKGRTGLIGWTRRPSFCKHEPYIIFEIILILGVCMKLDQEPDGTCTVCYLLFEKTNGSFIRLATGPHRSTALTF